MLYNTSCFKKPKGATSGGGTAYPSGAPEFIPVFNGVRVARSLVLYVCVVDCCLSFCTSPPLVAPFGFLKQLLL
jgi:hypothetical protein